MRIYINERFTSLKTEFEEQLEEEKCLNEQVKRNIDRFPEIFKFQLTDIEKNELVTNCDRFKNLKHSSVNPYVFTEQGVAMLSSVLRSETAVYHFGASLKDLGKKWFAFSKMDMEAISVITKLKDRITE